MSSKPGSRIASLVADQSQFRIPVLLLLLAVLSGCLPILQTNDPDDPDDSEPCEPVFGPQTIGPDDRPAEVQGPPDWCSNHPLPVVVLLHGFTATADLQDLLFRLSSRVEEERFLLVLPDGTEDPDGNHFWNATDWCCDFHDTGVDDVAYLSSLLDELDERFSVERERVYFTGHSNGSFMSYRMACDRPDLVTAIAGLAGATHLDEDDCGNGGPVSVLHLHGRLDSSIFYDGLPLSYPGATATARRWADRAGCTAGTSEEGKPRDLVESLPGAETTVRNYEGCEPGIDVTLWTIEGGGHVPILNEGFSEDVISWLLAHSR